MGKDSHYIPEIQEFHPGFHYEEKVEGEWVKRIFEITTPMLDVLEKIETGLIRVKYLDEEDILDMPHSEKLEPMENPYADNSFGVKMEPFQKYWIYDQNTMMYAYTITMLHDRGRSIINIENSSGTMEFRGNCLNKNELRKLLTRIGVI